MPSNQFAALATGRDTSLFAQDIRSRRPEIAAAIAAKRILVVGGAGSIGQSTVEQIVPFAPRALHVVDQNENALAELVRTLRSGPTPPDIADLRTLPLDYGSAAFRAFLRASGPYDLVLNFAAIKHVRSEKDSFSTLQMFDTNIVKQAALVRLLADAGFSGRYFSVSTDKAANPTSMMGATKRVMEHVMFDPAVATGFKATVTSARFANVAFSNGSLLQSFENRLAKGQPLAAPRDTKRYFVSLEESGQLCLLAATTATHGHIMVPRLDPETHLVEMQAIAMGFLRANGFAPKLYDDETLACRNVAQDRETGQWPLLVTPLDTSGEKPYEEFVAKGERLVDHGYHALSAVPYLPLSDPGTMPALLAEIDAIFAAAESGDLAKDRLKTVIARAEPAFLQTHRETGRSLDEKV